jgi:twitching motility protein PilT
LIGTPAVGHLIREKKTHSITTVIQTGQQLGMKSLDQSLVDLYLQGKITAQEALYKAQSPEEVRDKMEAATNPNPGKKR